MGYYIHITDCNIRIPKNQFANACMHLEQIGFLTDTEHMTGGCMSGESRKHWYAWVDMGELEHRIESGDLVGVLDLFGFETGLDKESLENLFFNSKSGNEEHLLRCLAPFFRDGDYIEWQGEEGERWRYVFENGKMDILHPTVIWD